MIELSYELFYAQFRKRDLIKRSDKIEIYNVFEEETKTVRILKICKGRDLSAVCKSLMSVRHPNVAVVYDYVYYNGDTHILEEKLSGCNLAEKLEREGKLSPKETVEIISKVCDGLSELHEMTPPVIHNDIKPSNIYICDDGNVKLFDFDISRTYKEDAKQNTLLMGTEDFASPEHYGFGQTDQRSDIYSLGVTMHKMLSGKVLNEKKKPTYTGDLSEIINKCVLREPEERYGSVKELKKAFEEQDVPKKGKFGGILFAVIVCAVLVFGIGFFVKLGMNNNETKPSVQDPVGSGLFTDNNSVSITEKINATNNTTTQPAPNNTKAIKVVSKTSGEIVSMVSLNDGTIVYIESTGNENHIKTSEGVDKILPLDGDSCHLLYNVYTNKLYVVYNKSASTDVELYLIDENYNIGGEPLYASKRGYGSGSSGFFLSDGTLYCDFFEKNLIDSNQWIEIGSASFTANTQLSDRMFYINSFTVTEEFVHGAESISYNVPWDYLLDGEYCTTNDGIYFIAKTNNKDYIYKFDGETFVELLCLDNYKYYTHSSYEKFGVTEDKIWLYDATANTIKELPIE